MLHVSKVAGRGVSYYLDDLGAELDAVAPLHRGGDAGRWVGRGSIGLGLVGPVDSHALQALLDGANPRTGRPLVSTARRSVAGFDLTFSVPKSASLIFALGDPETSEHVLAGHLDAVHAAMGYLERRALAVRRGTGEDRQTIPVGGAVAASFTHALSRAGDPHLHTHVVEANLAHGADGRWSAIDSRGLFAHARAAGSLHDAHLRAELTDRLGLSWSWHEGRGWDIAGADPLVLAAFSGRASEIRQELAVRATRSERARHLAWASTREAKVPWPSPSELRADWSQRASIAPELRLERPGDRGSPSDRVDEHRFAAAIAACPPSGVCRRDVVAAWSSATPHGARADDLERAVDHWASVPDGAIGVVEPKRAPATCVPAPHLLRALGPRPAAPEGQPVWRRAAAAIDQYRARWGIEDHRHPLGTEVSAAPHIVAVAADAGNPAVFNANIQTAHGFTQRTRPQMPAGFNPRNPRHPPTLFRYCAYRKWA